MYDREAVRFKICSIEFTCERDREEFLDNPESSSALFVRCEYCGSAEESVEKVASKARIDELRRFLRGLIELLLFFLSLFSSCRTSSIDPF